MGSDRIRPNSLSSIDSDHRALTANQSEMNRQTSESLGSQLDGSFSRFSRFAVALTAEKRSHVGHRFFDSSRWGIRKQLAAAALAILTASALIIV